jgi:hypothetical protein
MSGNAKQRLLAPLDVGSSYAPSVLFDTTRFDTTDYRFFLHWDALLNLVVLGIGMFALHYNIYNNRDDKEFYFYAGSSMSFSLTSVMLLAYYLKEMMEGCIRDDGSERITIQRNAVRRTIHTLTNEWLGVVGILQLLVANVNYQMSNNVTKLSYTILGSVCLADSVLQHAYFIYNWTKRQRALKDAQ